VRGRDRLSERRLAVDLGTANTVVYQRGRGVIAFEPSVVAIDERTGDVYAVGEEARRMIGRTPAHIKATRPLRHGVIADFETTEHMLRYFIRSAVRRLGGGAEVMVCIPSGVTQVERTAVEEATIGAGAARAYLIEEPLAAAIGAGLPVAESIGSFVLDVGGGTSEMAVTALGGMVVSHSVRVGGYDLDEAIVKLLQDRHRLLIGQEQAERVKLDIGAARPQRIEPAVTEVAAATCRPDCCAARASTRRRWSPRCSGRSTRSSRGSSSCSSGRRPSSPATSRTAASCSSAAVRCSATSTS